MEKFPSVEKFHFAPPSRFPSSHADQIASDPQHQQEPRRKKPGRSAGNASHSATGCPVAAHIGGLPRVTTRRTQTEHIESAPPRMSGHEADIRRCQLRADTVE